MSDNTLTIYIFPSPNGINWENPEKVTKSTLGNLLTFYKNRSIGHTAIELTCNDLEGDPSRHILTGMTDSSSNAKYTSIFKKKSGLGILFESLPGRMEEAAPLNNEISKKLKRGSISFITFKISPSTCKRLVQYHDEYVQMHVYDYYGLPNRPRYKEGAGCSAFAVSFMELAGILEEQFYKNWSYNINVPLSLTGYPITNNKVSLLRLLLDDHNQRWAEENEPHKKIFFWDPDSMHRWVSSKVKNNSPDYQIVSRGKSKGLFFDRMETPTPTDPIWKTDRND